MLMISIYANRGMSTLIDDCEYHLLERGRERERERREIMIDVCMRCTIQAEGSHGW